MKKGKFVRFFSSILAFIMVFSLLAPMAVSANNGQANSFKQSLQDESMMQLKSAVAEQLNLLEGQPKLHKELQELSGNKEVPVIIQLSEKPVALEMGIKKLKGKQLSGAEQSKIKANIKAQQNLLKKEMAIKGIGYKQGFSYDTVLNGFAAKVQAKDLEKLIELDGVTLVEPDTTVYASESLSELPKNDLNNKFDKVVNEITPAMNTSISFLGIEKLWAEGIEGQGIKVAVLDTGIDADHPEFKDIYKGGKNFVPHTGSDYARERADDDASETSPLDRPDHRPEVNTNGSTFYTSHGTHVAGTIAAIGNNEFGIKGIAPKIDLYAYRVLGAYGSGAMSGIIAAIEESVVQEMDVINLSLGGGSNTETDSGSFAINNAMMAGTIGVLATGNSGPNRGTMGTPATSRLGIAVGNTTNPETMYSAQVNVKVNDYEYSKQVNLMATTFGQNLATQLNGEYEVVAVPGIGEAADFNGIDVDGKVALISRGEIPFVDKIENAKANGATATIIHNFAGGTNAPDISDVFLGDAFEFIPTFDMSQTDGDAIRAALQDGKGTVSFSNVKSDTTLGDEVNNSSSRGPSRPNFDIKPDVTAPGTNIMSTIPMYKADFPEAEYNEAYSRKTGTSMATPHIAGVAALVKQANPDWDAFDVKVALSNTAKILNTDKYDVFAQGAGRVQAYEAAHADVLAYAIDTADNDGEEVENLKGTVTFGPQSLESDLSVTKQILVKDLKNSGQNYDVSVDVTKSFGDAKLTIEKAVSSSANGEQLLNVTLTASQAETKSGDELLGYIHIKGEGTEISLPFAADFSGEAATEITNMSITETDLSFNGDGVQDEATLSFTLTGDVATNYVELWDIMNPDGCYYADGYIGYLHAGNSLGAGTYTLRIAGEYMPWNPDESVSQIPDGLYTIDFTALTVSGNPPVIGDYVGPIIVKSTKPEIAVEVEGDLATGQITDKYLDYNEELAKYGLNYDINEKLKASYVMTKNGEAEEAVPFKLAQDGSFEFTADFNSATNVAVVVEDAAGNKAEAVIYEGEEDETAPESEKFAVSYEDIASYLNDTKAKEVVLNVPEYDSEIAVELSGDILQTILVAKKDVIIESDGAGFYFKNNAVEQLWNKAKSDVTITLGNDDASSVKNAISNTYSIEIEKGLGENKEKLQNFNETIDIILPIDKSKLKNEKKVAVYESNSDSFLKAKYHKGVLEFDTTETGSFTVVNN